MVKKNIQDPEFWKKQTEKLKEEAENIGKKIAIGLVGYMGMKGAAAIALAPSTPI